MHTDSAEAKVPVPQQYSLPVPYLFEMLLLALLELVPAGLLLQPPECEGVLARLVQDIRAYH